MSGHTPGPWHTGEKNKFTVYCKMGQRIANSFDNIPVLCRSDAQCEANAKLIAAAPDLLEALQLADAALRGSNMDMVVVERKVTAAIAKATEVQK